MTNHSKYYYELNRNMSATSDINPKMKMTKEELGIKKEVHQTLTGGLYPVGARSMDVKGSDDRVPDYYKGKNGYEARKVCDNFDLSYHLATATTYILRAYHKHDTPVDCITKAIAHLQFELDKIKDEKANL